MERLLPHGKGLVALVPQVVVDDGPDFLAILSQPAMTWLSRDLPDRSRLPLEERLRLYQKPELTEAWSERTAGERAVLTLHPNGAAYSIRLFWGAGWSFQNWYINLEPPFVRTETGIQVSDQHLDVVVSPALEWSWKDADEFAALCAAGYYSASEELTIRTAAQQAIERVEKRRWPFDGPWPEWRPDPRWPVPQIADHWPTKPKQPGVDDRADLGIY